MEKKDSKRKFNLEKDIIKVEYNNSEPTFTYPEQTKSLPKTNVQKNLPVTLSLPPDIIKELKLWSVNNNTTLSKAVEEGFYLLKNR